MRLAVLVLEDEPEVRAALERDLMALVPTIRLESAEDVTDAREVVAEIFEDGDLLALALCDHRLPGTSGVDFLVEMAQHQRTVDTRKVLVTGQADLADTVKAVNEAELDRYIAKPWTREELVEIVSEQLTDYVEIHGINPLPHLAVLEHDRALHMVRSTGRAD
ncbi:MAG: response regulator [Ancrocorticia sp.]|uniref:response regulator n=1 Tax=Ancrocorticia sp. TaxID=2593684 RepID=UPI003F8F5FE7